MQKLLIAALILTPSFAWPAELELSTACNPCQVDKKLAIHARVTEGGDPVSGALVKVSVATNGMVVTRSTKPTNATGNAQVFVIPHMTGAVAACAVSDTGAVATIEFAVE